MRTITVLFLLFGFGSFANATSDMEQVRKEILKEAARTGLILGKIELDLSHISSDIRGMESGSETVAQQTNEVFAALKSVQERLDVLENIHSPETFDKTIEAIVNLQSELDSARTAVPAINSKLTDVASGVRRALDSIEIWNAKLSSNPELAQVLSQPITEIMSRSRSVVVQKFGAVLHYTRRSELSLADIRRRLARDREPMGRTVLRMLLSKDLQKNLREPPRIHPDFEPVEFAQVAKLLADHNEILARMSLEDIASLLEMSGKLSQLGTPNAGSEGELPRGSRVHSSRLSRSDARWWRSDVFSQTRRASEDLHKAAHAIDSAVQVEPTRRFFRPEHLKKALSAVAL